MAKKKTFHIFHSWSVAKVGFKLCDGVYAGTPTAGIVNSALGSLRAEVAERGTQITQPPCTSSYVRWRFCTTQSVKKLSCSYLTTLNVTARLVLSPTLQLLVQLSLLETIVSVPNRLKRYPSLCTDPYFATFGTAPRFAILRVPNLSSPWPFSLYLSSPVCSLEFACV